LVSTIGVLALQGDVREHVRSLTACGAEAVPVRRPEELERIDGLVLPGGESTTMWKLARTFELLDPLRKRVEAGMPAYGSCAGMIMLADRIADGIEGQETVGGIDMLVRRNAFGRQVDSFEDDVTITGFDPPFHAVFIRAPWVEAVGPDVEILGRIGGAWAFGPEPAGPLGAAGSTQAAGRIVAVRQGSLLATSFHPELTGDARIHRLFVEMVKEEV
jgi:5'-phosphate synthase pdxT subunit